MSPTSTKLKVIEKLTPEQEQKLVEYREEWLSRGYNTKPIDLDEATEAITAIYAQIGKPAPIVVHCTSPWQMAYMRAAYKALGKLDLSQLDSQLRSQLRSQLGSPLGSQLWSQLGSQLDSQLDSQLRSQLDSQLWSQLRSQLRSQLVSQLGSQLDSQLGSQLRSQLDSQLWSQLRSQLVSQLRSQLGSQLDSQLDSQLRSQLDSQLWSQLRSQLDSQLRSQLGSQLGSQLRSQLDSQLRSQLGSQLGSQLDSPLGSQKVTDFCFWTGTGFLWWYSCYFAFIEFGEMIGAQLDQEKMRQWREWMRLAKAVHGFWAFDGICFISDRPTSIKIDDRFRLHNENSPALQYADGYAVYAWHGARIDWEKAFIIDRPSEITVAGIEKETNQEIRRVMIDRYGQDKFLMDAGAQKVQEDDFGVLYRKQLQGDEDLVMVKVVNSTPEPDGTYKDYFIRVPPLMKTARQAIAWTFGKEAEDYAPLVQT